MMNIKIRLYKQCGENTYHLLLFNEFNVNKAIAREDIDFDKLINVFKKDGCNLKIKIDKSKDGYYFYLTISDVIYNSIWGVLRRVDESVFIANIYETFITYFKKEICNEY